MGLKYFTPAQVDSYVNPWGCSSTFSQNAPNVNLAAAQAQFPTSEFRALVDGGGNILFLHLSGYPNTYADWPSLDIQGNYLIAPLKMMSQIAELAPWIFNPYNSIRITTGGLWYNVSLTGLGAPNTAARAITPAAYLLAYGALMGPVA